MERGFKPGTGFDQVYVKKNPDGSVAEYVIVEAKGLGATLSKNAKKGEQMSTSGSQHGERDGELK